MAKLGVVLFLAERHPAHEHQQGRHKRRTHARHRYAQRSCLPPRRIRPCACQAHAHRARVPGQHAARHDRDATPQRHLAEVVRMSALRPQPPCQKLLAVLLLALLLRPLVLLAVGQDLEAEAAGEKGEAERIGEDDGARECGEDGRGDGVDGENGEQANADPSCLEEEGGEESRGGVADGGEAGVGA